LALTNSAEITSKLAQRFSIRSARMAGSQDEGEYNQRSAEARGLKAGRQGVDGPCGGTDSYLVSNPKRWSSPMVITESILPNLKQKLVEWVWLFWPRPRRGPRPRSVAEYLEAGLARGSHLGQKTRERESWYLTEINPDADGFMSGMTSVGPWLCLNHSAEVTATNTLYTVHFHQPLKMHEKAAWALALLCSPVAAQHARIGRCYSKGLLKFEPRDVMSLTLPVAQVCGRQAIVTYKQAITALLRGEVCTARALADSFFLDKP
jgi:hypothetical protein